MKDVLVCPKGTRKIGNECIPRIYHHSNIELLKIDFGNVRTTITYKNKNSDLINVTTFIEEKTETIRPKR